MPEMLRVMSQLIQDNHLLRNILKNLQISRYLKGGTSKTNIARYQKETLTELTDGEESKSQASDTSNIHLILCQ